MIFYILIQGRASQLYKAGYKTLNDVAKANKKELCNVINHLPLKVAREIIASAKVNAFFIYNYIISSKHILH